MYYSNKSILTDNYLKNLSEPFRFILLIFIGSIFLTISAKISIPFLPVPMTMQTLVVLFIGMTFGRILAPATICLYLFQGAIGLPVFASGGGILYLFGPTGGYLFGFLLSSIALSNLAAIGWDKKYSLTLLSLILGISIIFIVGLLQLAFVLNLTFIKSIQIGLSPFIFGEIFKILILTILIPFISNKH
jgi:biotin transport system substrate-specific component